MGRKRWIKVLQKERRGEDTETSHHSVLEVSIFY